MKVADSVAVSDGEDDTECVGVLVSETEKVLVGVRVMVSVCDSEREPLRVMLTLLLLASRENSMSIGC